MKKRILTVISILAAVIVFILLLWRFIPRSCSGILSADVNDLTLSSAHATVHRIENGQPFIDFYRAEDSISPEILSADLTAILASCQYRPHLRNLLPWPPSSVSAGADFIGRSVALLFTYSDQPSELIDIQFLSPDLIAISSPDTSGFRLYHPTDPNTLDELVEYIQTHGTKK